MIRDTAAAVNATATPPPVPIWYRWPCPLCGALYRHPWYMAAHLMRPAGQHGHALGEQDAWTRAAAVPPVEAVPGADRYPARPPVPMAAPLPALAR